MKTLLFNLPLFSFTVVVGNIFLVMSATRLFLKVFLLLLKYFWYSFTVPIFLRWLIFLLSGFRKFFSSVPLSFISCCVSCNFGLFVVLRTFWLAGMCSEKIQYLYYLITTAIIQTQRIICMVSKTVCNVV